MSVNISPGQNIVRAVVTIDVVATGITAQNVLIMYHMLPDSSPSNKPGEDLQGFTQFVQGEPYYIKALQPLDLSQYLTTSYGTGNGILLENGTSIIPE